EDLLGKTWREEELEPFAGLELVEVASTRHDDGEFRVETGYLANLADGTLYREVQITPLQLRSARPRPLQRVRLLVDEARLYPGLAPRRIKLVRTRRAPLNRGHVERLLGHAETRLVELRRRLIERLGEPLGA